MVNEMYQKGSNVSCKKTSKNIEQYIDFAERDDQSSGRETAINNDYFNYQKETFIAVLLELED